MAAVRWLYRAGLAGAVALAVGLCQQACAQAPATPPGEAIAAKLGLPGQVILETRLRYEGVAQEGLENANALTFAGRLGYQLEPLEGLTLLAELEGVAQLTRDFADTVRVRPGLPVVADPEALELNRLQIRYAAPAGLTATLGRQRIIWDDARFVGNVVFRQNEQTFDALHLDWRPAKTVQARYAYLDRVNRIFGDQSPVGEFRSDSHIAQLDWRPQSLGTLAAYALALDFANSPANSHLTYGLRWNRPFTLGAWRAKLGLEAARQSAYRGNSPEFAVHYAKTLAGVGIGSVDLAFTGEWLEGDGTRGFETPLATLHAFQGFADVFLATPPDGLRDLNLSGTWKLARPPVGQAFSLLLRGHQFTNDSGGAELGREFDALARFKANAWLTLELRSALFDGRDPRFPDRTRVWLAMETAF